MLHDSPDSFDVVASMPPVTPGIKVARRAELGYRCGALGQDSEDPRSGELLQVNRLLVKRPPI